MIVPSELRGWGGFPMVEARELISEDLEAISRGAVLSRGLGRSYGDASLPPDVGSSVAATRLADRLLAFDAETGVLRAEAGTSLAHLNTVFWRRGWTVPVSPGTQFVTLGGMVACDVHGKNHHVAGCIGEHVKSLRMRLPGGQLASVDEISEPELFRATLGGMGLTGHVLEVELQLQRIPSPWIRSESERVRDLDELMTRLREAGREWPLTVAWADSLTRGPKMGRGILFKGRWAQASEAPSDWPRPLRRVAVPFAFPAWFLGRWMIQLFNHAYYRSHPAKVCEKIVHPENFFYPLDQIRHWNRLYGRAGVVQYQCVVPRSSERASVRRLFETMTARGGSSFLTVVKDCGDAGKGMLSFPMPGVSVALDLPMRGPATQDLVDALNEVVVDAGGRIYLAKDALTRREHFEAMEPRLADWNAVRRKWDPEIRMRSAQSVRLLGDPQ